jgi:hypothetical protein
MRTGLLALACALVLAACLSTRGLGPGLGGSIAPEASAEVQSSRSYAGFGAISAMELFVRDSEFYCKAGIYSQDGGCVIGEVGNYRHGDKAGVESSYERMVGCGGRFSVCFVRMQCQCVTVDAGVVDARFVFESP